MMKKVIYFLFVILFMTTLTLSTQADARGIGSSLEKVLAKRLIKPSKLPQKNWQAVAEKDAKNHLKPAQALPKTRIVERYTSQQQAQKEVRFGLRPHTHMTTGVHHGHPYSKARIKQRYGIENTKSVEVKETIRIPAGHPVLHNKVPGGEAGVGEITSPKSLPKQSIIKITPAPH